MDQVKNYLKPHHVPPHVYVHLPEDKSELGLELVGNLIPPNCYDPSKLMPLRALGGLLRLSKSCQWSRPKRKVTLWPWSLVEPSKPTPADALSPHLSSVPFVIPYAPARRLQLKTLVAREEL